MQAAKDELVGHTGEGRLEIEEYQGAFLALQADKHRLQVHIHDVRYSERPGKKPR